jgi:hypothetical protein
MSTAERVQEVVEFHFAETRLLPAELLQLPGQ